MSPKLQTTISDRQSKKVEGPRGRPAIRPQVVLVAASALFAKANSQQAVTMDAIAAEAGIGKGTIFRAFGSREGLLHALWAAELAELRGQVKSSGPPLGPGAPSVERAAAFLDALLAFKLKNRQLIRALELGPGVLQSEHYRWMKSTLQHFIADASPTTTKSSAGYAAHVLLAAMHIDLLEEMIAGGLSYEGIKQAQAIHLKALIHSAR